ncbi:MAG: beta-lactamase family protein [Calditrichaeota bacterium]|nr:beta-lactamase family protein [Calditrichota bacterium]
MKRNSFFFIFFALIFTVQIHAHTISVAQNTEVMDKLKLFETWVQAEMDYYNLSGLAIGIVCDKDLVWEKGFGFADLKKKTPMTPRTLFRLASITKLFTSTAIMQLRDAGKLQLTDPIEKYLPWFKIRNRFPNEPPITIWHILTHTSGLPREAAFPYWTDHNFPTLQQIIEKLPQQETIFPPETKWKYSNLAMALLGAIVESAAGEKYDQYIQKHILAPLKMNNTSIYLTKEQKKSLATGYGIRLPNGEREVMPFTDAKGLTPAANMTSNIEDMAKFVSSQFFESNTLKKGQLLKASTLRQMHRVQWLMPSWNSGWGLGFSIRHYGNRTLIGHAGWVGGFRSQIYFDKKAKVGVIVFSNSEDGSPTKFALKFFDMIAPSIENALQKEEEPVPFDRSWEKFVGTYEDPSHWAEKVMILDKKLYLYGYDYPPEDNPEASLTELFPEGENTFRMTNGNGELVIFEFDKKGNIVRIKKGENYLYPVKK